MNFEFNLNVVLAHSILFETKNVLSPNGVVDDARNGGDPPAPTVNESMAQQLQAYIKNIPDLAKVTSQQVLPTEQALTDAQKVIAPQQQQLLTDLFAKYGPQLNDVGNIINATNAKAGAQSDLDVLKGPGSELLAKTQEEQRKLDPEFYKTRALTGQKTDELLNSINLNGLSGGERAEVERSVNQDSVRRGTSNAPSNIQTVDNAMKFGSALGAKRNQLADAISRATNFLPSAQSGISAFQVATGKPAGNQGATQFGGVAPVGNQTFAQGNALLGNINQTANNSANIDANRRDSLDKVSGVLGSLPT